jgi:hypothetical protein
MSLFGKVFGDSKDDKQGQNATARQTEIAQWIFENAKPVAESLSGRYKNFLDGNLDVTGTPQYAAMKSAADSQFGRARDNIIATSAPGGALTSALANLETNRALGLVQGAGTLAENEMSRAFGIGTNQVPVALQGYGNAAQTSAYRNAAASQQNSQAMQGIGYGAGRMFGGQKDTSSTANLGGE